jgi:hypothetical protein
MRSLPLPPVPDPDDAAVLDWPPPPHDPRERAVLFHIAGGWEVRAFPRDDRRFAYFVPRGLWHLQLWHPSRRISILTPSRLTRGLYEIFPVNGWKTAAPDIDELRSAVESAHAVTLPGPAALAALELWLVHGEVRRLTSPSDAS